MKLSSDQASKIDAKLKKALEQAEGHEQLRAVMVLGSGKPLQITNTPQPNDFSDRTTYREALITKQQQQTSDQLSGIKQELTDRSLSVKGGNISRAVVVEGTAGAILLSLDLAEVQHASLDQKITLYPDNEL